jgi:hypothetical protein
MISCRGCMFLFARDDGYSNYTVMDTEVHCAADRNEKLPADAPDEVETGESAQYSTARVQQKSLHHQPAFDGWHATKEARCAEYTPAAPDAKWHHIDCEGGDIYTEQPAIEHLLQTGDFMPLLIRRYFDKKGAKKQQ